MNNLLDEPSEQPSSNSVQFSNQEPEDYSALRQLLTHVPDIVINCDHKKSMPRVNRVVGVCMFADISGEWSDLIQWNMMRAIMLQSEKRLEGGKRAKKHLEPVRLQEDLRH